MKSQIRSRQYSIERKTYTKKYWDKGIPTVTGDNTRASAIDAQRQRW